MGWTQSVEVLVYTKHGFFRNSGLGTFGHDMYLPAHLSSCSFPLLLYWVCGPWSEEGLQVSFLRSLLLFVFHSKSSIPLSYFLFTKLSWDNYIALNTICSIWSLRLESCVHCTSIVYNMVIQLLWPVNQFNNSWFWFY